MAEQKSLRVKLILGASKGKPVRFSYLSVHSPRLNQESGIEEYSVAALIPKTNVEDVKAIKEAIEQLRADEWTSKKKPIPPKFWNPLRDGDTDTKQNGEPLGEYAKGHYVLNCKTAAFNDKGEPMTPPQVVGITKDAGGKFIRLSKGEVKSGDYGRIGVMLGAYSKGTGGVGAYLTNVQLVREGEALGSSRSAEDDFGSFEDEEDIDPLMQ